MELTDIPYELQSLIYQQLSLKSIAHLRQSCQLLNRRISQDKRLWLSILSRDVLDDPFPLIPNHVPLHLASCRYIEHLVQNAILLRKSYRTAVVPDIQTTTLHPSLEVTWMKILRSKWCLVASSNLTQSSLSFWEVAPNGGGMLLCTTYYLPGPVLDGVIYDSGETIDLAITVATGDPYIEIIACRTSPTISLSSQCVVPKARTVRFLKGALLGFAVYEGDDLCPYLFDYRSHVRIKLTPSCNVLTKEGRYFCNRSGCLAMTIHGNFVLVVTAITLDVYPIDTSEASNTCCVNELYSLPLCEFQHSITYASQAVFHVSRRSGNVADSMERIYLTVKKRSGVIVLYTITSEGDRIDLSCKGMKSDEDTVELPNAVHISLGSASNYLLFIRNGGCFRRGVATPTLRIAQFLRNPTNQSVTAEYSDCSKPFEVGNCDASPYLQLFTCMDFDDAAGIFILGTRKGEITMGQFVHRDASTKRSGPGDKLREYPMVTENFKNPMTVDLPPCYRFSAGDLLDKDLPFPSLVMDGVISEWQRSAVHCRITGWSNDWRSFNQIRQWIAPLRRWKGVADVDKVHGFGTTTCRLIRGMIHTEGDIIPLIYRDAHHKSVIFRVGSRAYYFHRRNSEDHTLSMIPITLQPEVDHDTLLALIESSNDLPFRLGEISTSDYLWDVQSEEFQDVLEYAQSEEGRREVEKIRLVGHPRSWETKDWRKLLNICDIHWMVVHGSCNYWCSSIEEMCLSDEE